MIKVIHPYKKNGYWTFIDPGTGRTEAENMLVAGIDLMLDDIAKSFGSFSLAFSDRGFSISAPVFKQITMTWHSGDKENKLRTGNYYRNTDTGIVGWLCPVLFDYFTTAPDTLYVTILIKECEEQT